MDVFRPPSTIKGVCVGENYNIFYNDKKACLFDMNSLEVLDELDSSRISPGSAEFSFNESFVLLTGLSSSLLWDITNKTEKNIPLTKVLSFFLYIVYIRVLFFLFSISRLVAVSSIMILLKSILEGQEGQLIHCMILNMKRKKQLLMTKHVYILT